MVVGWCPVQPRPACPSLVPFLAFFCSTFHHRDLTLAGCISQPLLSAGCCLANDVHWLEIGRWEKGRSRGISPSLSQSEAPSWTVRESPPFLQLPPERPTAAPASTGGPHPWALVPSLPPSVPPTLGRQCLLVDVYLWVTSPSSLQPLNSSITQVTTSLSLIPSAVYPWSTFYYPA